MHGDHYKVGLAARHLRRIWLRPEPGKEEPGAEAPSSRPCVPTIRFEEFHTLDPKRIILSVTRKAVGIRSVRSGRGVLHPTVAGLSCVRA